MIEDVLIILIWIMLPIGWHYLLKIAGLSLFRVTIPSFVIVFFYLYQYIGIPILYFQLDGYRAQYVTDKFLMMEVFFYTSLTITLMIFGYMIACKQFGTLKWEDKIDCNKKNISSVMPGGISQNFSLMVFALIGAIALYMYLSIVGFQKTAILIAVGAGEDISVGAVRSAMGNSFAGKYHWYKLFMNDILRFVLFAFFAQYLVKKTYSIRIILLPIFLLTTFVMVMATEKGLMINLLIGLFLVYILVIKSLSS